MANKAKRLEEEHRAAMKSAYFTDTFQKKTMQRVAKKKAACDIYAELRLGNFKEKELRQAGTHVVRSYNATKQKELLIKHLYVKYPVPNFFLGLFEKGEHQHFGIDWFFCLAQGGSFQKMVKNIMTKKEVISFLGAPESYSVQNAFWYAKMHNRDIAPKIIHALLFKKEIFRAASITNPETHGKFIEIIDFYGKYFDEMDEQTVDEVSDFIRSTIPNAAFSLAGRTLNSVKMLSNEWHTLMQKAKLGSKISWDGIQEKPWSFEEKNSNRIWEVVELTTNHALINEGRKNKNCVSGYVNACNQGDCNIFSLRKFHAATLEEITSNRVTIELRRGKVVQARGYCNRSVNSEEQKMINKWCEAVSYRYAPRDI